MIFKPDITKQAVEVIFSAKNNKPDHPFLFFNNIPVAREIYTKLLRIFLDEKFSFFKHIKEKSSITMDGTKLLMSPIQICF